MSAPKGKNTDPSPMTFETHVAPNLANERARLAREALYLSKEELAERASEVGIPTDGTKVEIAKRVADAARTD